MPSISEELVETVAAKKRADVIGKILFEHAKELERLSELHGRRTNIAFLTKQMLDERKQ